MCEYCGCQQLATIGELTREHDAVVAEIAEVRSFLRDGNVEGAAKTAGRIAEILGPHTAVEEGGLFPLMAGEFPDHIEALEREHRTIEGVLAEAADGPPADPAWPSRLVAALELLRDHILKEQDGVFPAALSVLDGDGWERVEAARALAGSALSPDGPTHQDHHQHDPHGSQHHPHRHTPEQEDDA
jgi:hemerythrin-like domain-containing protein